jgi:BirA family biotin operon repressor/biotin-[acetyl-CoA-carboxylase] ligase
MNWDLEALKESFTGKLFGHNFYFYSETTSTNDKAFSLGTADAPEGTAVIADSQSGGKGRFQRSWYSPPGVNIYTSVILRPKIESFKASQIPIMAGVAVAQVLDSLCPGKIKLKWPNDVLLNEKKVCGILSQAKIIGGKIDFIVLGIGINVNIGYNQFSEELRGSSSSLVMETGKEISRQELIISIYENLEKWYKQLLRKGFDEIKKRWLEIAPMIGQTVQVIFQEESVSGRVAGLADDGSLILFSKGNKEIKVSAGDATIMR